MKTITAGKSQRVPFQEIGKAMRQLLSELYGHRMKYCLFFGSYARDEADAESDLDVLIVLDRVNHYAAEVDRTSKITSELSLQFDVSISRVFLSEEEWHDGDSAFVLNVREEAIPL